MVRFRVSVTIRFGVSVKVRVGVSVGASVTISVGASVIVSTNRRYSDCADLPPAVTLDGGLEPQGLG